MTNPASAYRAAAAALRELLARTTSEPDQQVLAAAALCLDHAAVQAEAMAAMVTWDRESLIREALDDYREPRPPATRDERVRDLMPTGPVRYVREP